MVLVWLQVASVLRSVYQFVLICLINEHILRLMAGDNHSFMVSVYVSLNKGDHVGGRCIVLRSRKNKNGCVPVMMKF